MATLVSPLYRVHKNGSPLIWSVKDKSTVVAFSDSRVALKVACVAESHYVTHKEWSNGLEFSFKKEVIPVILGVDEISFDAMKTMCALWDLNLVIIDEFEQKKSNTIRVSGEVMTFDVPETLRVNHLNSLWYKSGPF